MPASLTQEAPPAQLHNVSPTPPTDLLLPVLVHAELDPMIDTLMLADVGMGVSVEQAETAVLE